jgi:hypothetical protein
MMMMRLPSRPQQLQFLMHSIETYESRVELAQKDSFVCGDGGGVYSKDLTAG